MTSAGSSPLSPARQTVHTNTANDLVPTSKQSSLWSSSCAATNGCYSITSSARASIVGGTSSPSVFAVLRLIMNSNLVGCSAQRAVRAIRNSKSLSGQGPQLLGSKPPVLLVKTPTCKNHLLKRVWESVRRAGVGKGRQATVYVQEIPALGRRALAIRELPMRCAARLPWCSHALP